MTEFFDFAMQSVVHFGGSMFMIFWIALCARFVIAGFEVKSVNVQVSERR